jgi:iron complex transport system substrate-binding protein
MSRSYRFLSSVLFTFSLTGFALLALLLPALAAEELPQPFEDPSRLVSIGGSLTEIVYALGHEGQLVGRDSTSVYPPQVSKIPDVGYSRQLAPEGVLSVAPTAILLLEGGGPPEAIEVLEKASVPLLIIPETFDEAGILRKIRFTGAALGEAEKAEELALAVERDIASARELIAGGSATKRVLFILSVQGGRILASGRGTAADGIIAMAGAVNVFQDYDGYKQVSDEAVMEAAPDVILMMSRGEDLDVANTELLANAALAATPAAQNGAIVRMDGVYLLGFGPRTGQAVRDLAVELYGKEVRQ